MTARTQLVHHLAYTTVIQLYSTMTKYSNHKYGMHTANNSSYHSIQCQLVNQKSSVLTESLSCCVFLCPMLLLQHLVGMLDEVLADEKQHEWMLLQEASAPWSSSYGRRKPSQAIYVYYVSKHNLLWGERGVIGRHGKVVRKHCRCTSTASCRTIM